VRLGETGVEEGLRQVERQRIEPHKPAAQRLHRSHVGQHVGAEARDVGFGRPLVHGVEAAVGQHVGMIGRLLATQEVGLVLARLLALRGGVGRRLPRDRHVADIVLVDLDRELGLEWQRVEARGLGIGRIDQGLRHAVAREIVEADSLEGEAQLRGGTFGRTGLARQEAGHVDQRDLAADHGRRHQRGTGRSGLRLHR
jgi:hypothetical protein